MVVLELGTVSVFCILLHHLRQMEVLTYIKEMGCLLETLKGTPKRYQDPVLCGIGLKFVPFKPSE